MRRPLLLTLCAAVVVSATVAAPGGAEAQARQAKQFLRRKHQRVMRLMDQETDSEQRKERLESLLQGLLDYEELSRRALASHWKGRSEAEREKFVKLLRQLVKRSYKRNLEQTLDYDVDYEQAVRRGETVLVRTVARSRNNPRAPEVSIDYRLKRSGGDWRVYDVITDGVSMVENYRDQFSRIIDKDGWDGLVQRMKKKLES